MLFTSLGCFPSALFSHTAHAFEEVLGHYVCKMPLGDAI
ncbi:hypothetical protein APHNP_0007 [Anaplasma phagocytophilum str. ApNP]|uniref:Uncharacterized protein n=1 Tax=Anaplasma phagocytophilum str. ApNP TaxID=1359153 RepID=A0A0F3NM81_ANAPH|nr:hypothetical protein APHNP_0007 [Anaplasma phagocytophilum str. ApNP]